MRDARAEGFDFLGYPFGVHVHPRDGQRYPGASPSRKSLKQIKTKIGELLARGNKAPRPEVSGRLNRVSIGWSACFSCGSCTPAYQTVDRHVRDFFAERRKEAGRGAQRFSGRRSSGNSACTSSIAGLGKPPPWSAGKSVGKPDARNPYVRFDEQGRRNDCQGLESPRPSSTLYRRFAAREDGERA